MIRLLFLLLLALPGVAAAHSRSETHAAWDVASNTVRLVVTLPDQEARRITAPPADAAVIAYLAARLGAEADGVACAAAEAPRVIAATPGFRRYEFAFACPWERGIVLWSDAFFDLVPTHVTYARIRAAGPDGEAHFVEQLFTSDQRRVIATPTEGELQGAPFGAFVLLGIEHILTGPDHVAFLLGLLLLARGLRDLAWVVTGFTLGHSITLGLAVTGLLRPETAYIDALIALTIALVGAENVVLATRRGAPVALGAGALLLGMALLRLFGLGNLPALLLAGTALFTLCYLMLSQALDGKGQLRAGIAGAFGLVHGFAFARDLVEMGLPSGRLAELLFGFNLGVEVGQLALVTIAWLVARLLMQLGVAPSRRWAVDLAAPALAGVGLFWMVSRVYG